MKTRIFNAIFFVLATSAVISAQDCYQDFLKRGINSYESFQFQQAVDLFNAAKICPDNVETQIEEIDGWITRANNGYINEITKARDEAVLLQKEALKQARLSEANRLAYLAAEELEKQNLDDALLLAFSALDMLSDEPLPQVRQIFGNVIGRTHAETIAGEGAAVIQVNFLDNKRLWSHSDGQSLSIWDDSGNQQTSLYLSEVKLTAADVSSNSQLAAAGFENGDLLLSDLKGKLMEHDSMSSDEALTCVAFSTDGNHLVTGYRDGTLLLRDQHGEHFADGTGLGSPVKDVKFSENGDLMICRMAKPVVKIVNLQNEITGEIEHEKHIYSAVFSPDDKTILTCSADGSARLSDSDGQMLITLKHPEGVHKAIFSPDGQKILTAALDQYIRLWDLNGNLLESLRSDGNIIQSIQFSPDGAHFLSFGTDNTARVWRNNGELVAKLDRHIGPILSASFSPDSKFILTTSADKTTKLWNLEGQLLMSADQYTGPVTLGRFSDDGEHILTCSEGGQILVLSNPITVFQQLQENPPEVTEEQKVKFGLNPQQ